MIAGGIAAGIAVLRRLPELGRDQLERQRLEDFTAAVIKECELGLAGGNRNSA